MALRELEGGRREGSNPEDPGAWTPLPSAAASDASAHPRLSSPSKLEKRSVFLDRSRQYANSDEEDGYESPDVKRRGASVDDFLKGSELGKPVSARHVAGQLLLPVPRTGLWRSEQPWVPERDGGGRARRVTAASVGLGS